MHLERVRHAPESLSDRWRKFAHEAMKFGVVGALNTVINFAVFNLLVLTVFVDGQLKANVAATVVAATSSYFMNRHWTYRDRPKATLRREYALFFLFNTTGMMIELGVLGLAKYGLDITSLAALNVVKAFGIGLGTVFRFWTYRTVVFKAAPRAADGMDAAPTGRADAPAAGHNGVAVSPATVAPAPREAPGPLAIEFAELTGPLEPELDPMFDAELDAELDGSSLAPKPTRGR